MLSLSFRVLVANNIRDKGEAVQAVYLEEGISIISITFSSSGIHVLLPPGLATTSASKIYLRKGKEEIIINKERQDISTVIGKKEWSFSFTNNSWQKWCNKLIGDVIECMDVVFGLNVPIFIFGYRKMRRCVSFRSNHRVPTHMAIMVGRGYSIASYIHSIGRLTGNSKSELNENGFDCVRILTTREDFKVAKKLRNFFKEIHDRLQRGETLVEAITGQNAAFPDDANFLRETFRNIGPIKSRRKQFEGMISFDEPTGLEQEDADYFNEKYGNDEDAKMLLRSLVRLDSAKRGKSWDGSEEIHIESIKDDLSEMENKSMSKKRLNELLKQFHDKKLITKDKQFLKVEHTAGFVHELFWSEEEDYDDTSEIEEDDEDEEEEDECEDISESEANLSTTLPTLINNTSQSNISEEKSVSSISISAVDMHLKRSRSNSNFVSPEKYDQPDCIGPSLKKTRFR
eukprot:scaffold29026_cov29-Cyclotella_meneghiniana.AAC.1